MVEPLCSKEAEGWIDVGSSATNTYTSGNGESDLDRTTTGEAAPRQAVSGCGILTAARESKAWSVVIIPLLFDCNSTALRPFDDQQLYNY